MAGPRKEDHVEVILLDQSVEMNVDKGQSGTRSPMAEQAGLDVLSPQRFLEQRIVQKIDHAETEVVAGSPVNLGFAQLLRAERLFFDGRASRTVRAKFENFGGCAGFDGTHE